jgi:hypothetical protein
MLGDTRPQMGPRGEQKSLFSCFRFIHSFVSLFSIYPFTGKTKDVKMVIIDVKVSVRSTDVK